MSPDVLFEEDVGMRVEWDEEILEHCNMDSISSELSVSTPSSSIIIDDDGTKEFFHHSNIKDEIINSRRRRHRDEKAIPLYSHNDSIVALIEKKTRHRHKREDHKIETESRRSSSVSFSTCYVREFDTIVVIIPVSIKGRLYNSDGIIPIMNWM